MKLLYVLFPMLLLSRSGWAQTVASETPRQDSVAIRSGQSTGVKGFVNRWKKQVKEGVKLSGSLNAYAGLYRISGGEVRNQPSPFGLSGQLTLTLPGGISLPFSAIVGNQGAAAAVRLPQPFNQLGISPTYGWAKAHIGYRNVSFSPFTLAGHLFLGGGVELNPGKWRLGAVYGRFNRAIASDLADPNLRPSFRRRGYSLKLGYGTQQNYVDVLLLRAADDVQSLPFSAEIPAMVTAPATTESSTTTARSMAPAENAVLGLSSRLLIRKVLSVEVDAALSAYTRDMLTRLTPTTASFQHRLMGVLIPLRASTECTSAMQTAIGYRSNRAGLKFQYKRIDPGFQTMGAYYFQNDIESYALAPQLTLWQGKIRLAGSYGWQFDNLTNTKNTRTGRRIGSANLSLNPSPKFGLDVQFSNYGISQRAGLRPLIDTLRLAQNNLSLTGNLRYTKQTEKVQHLFALTGSHQQLQDLNRTTANQTETRNLFVSLSYFYQHLTSGLGLNALLSYTETALPPGVRQPLGIEPTNVGGAATGNPTTQLAKTPGLGGLRFFGPTLGMNKNLGEKLTLSASANYLMNRQMGQTGQVLTLSANGGYRLSEQQNLSLDIGFLDTNTGFADQRFHEFRTTLSYGLSF